MKFADWAVIAVFGVLGYLLVGSTLNWLEEKKKVREKNGTSGNVDSNRDPASFRRDAGDSADAAPSAISSWYEILDVSEFATVEQIKSAYRQKISQYHPDKVAGMALEIRDLAEARSRDINAAYDRALKARLP